MEKSYAAAPEPAIRGLGEVRGPGGTTGLQLGVLVLGLVLIVAGGLAMVARRHQPAPPPESAESGAASSQRVFSAGKAEDVQGRLVDASLVRMPAGTCLVKHLPPTRISTASFSQYKQGDFAEIVVRPDDPWYAGQELGSCSDAFNCATFAVAPFVQLRPRDWLETSPAGSLPTPAAVVLDSYCAKVCEFSIDTAVDGSSFEQDARLREDDVVSFERAPTYDDPLRRSFTHLGRVARHNGVNRLLSKCGQGPVVVSDVAFASRLFPGAVKVVVYRPFTTDLDIWQ